MVRSIDDQSGITSGGQGFASHTQFHPASVAQLVLPHSTVHAEEE